ncbi:polyphenol oxidase family protein [Pengzhenrongella sp.]|uniref:polyphenol oxidase family protein n=1 Tax=Pengzhenrongella sp. TaxID=2888820 RepID=UPI002F91EF5F
MTAAHAQPGLTALPGGHALPVVEIDLGAGVRAGFTERGAFNLGLNVGDDPREVLARRARVEEWAGGPVAFVTQVHGADVAVVEPWSGPSPMSIGSADALVSARGVGLGILVADCVPGLLADPGAGVVAAVHAGRTGLVAGVVQAALAEMVAHGARTENIRAAIGPAICGACYEVPAAMRAEVADVVPATWGITSKGTPSLDLPAGVAALLAAAGVAQVQRLEICTLTDERFFSHRRVVRDGGTPGRFAGIVRTVTLVPGRVASER